ncbi:prepilin-type N-terminal cleavage/methylation domain-containing protein [Colwellia demingiae]|uniref:Prepilin-type N-terminal cleavage/methylation domain-containing protein n=1 Tax=Colwellia demingiae TaxID=89401 RepID=A0A5C6QPR2_9GAMM|nr:prepilin-type N-terminal cleavage/methylation domain-containing protein [Colwellia demingiae]TWX70681.1 prepilin-type N-terminal cleavage/methylation domain-containing protein [Colwellia demingiae]
MIQSNIHSRIVRNSNDQAKVHTTKQAGFTLIELVIVVVILGFLAATAIPKFVDLTEQAKQANIEGMAGGFATGVSLARAQWEVEARPKDTAGINMVNYDGTIVYLTSEDRTTSPTISPGYITGTNSGSGINGKTMAIADCISVWNSLLQQPPLLASSVTDINDDGSFRYLANVSGSGSSTLCHYHLKETLARDSDGVYIAPSPLTGVGNSFTYQPANSSVIIYINVKQP